MITVLDQDGQTVHLCYKHTHYTLCGVFRIGGRRGKPLKKVKDKPPSCLRCVALHGEQ